jgi:hypothetical protein
LEASEGSGLAADQRATITAQDIDELTAFLPLFEAEGRQYVRGWGGGETKPDGTWVLPYPVYKDDVWRFYWLAGQPKWADFDYVPSEAARMLRDDAFIEEATLAEVKTMLTYCVRGERFGDGHWAAMLESGRVSALLRRLLALRASLEEAEGSPGSAPEHGEARGP